MPKKSTPFLNIFNRQQPPEGDETPDSQSNRDLLRQMLHSPVLNGGFNAMMVKIDKIEEKQTDMSGKIDSIHEAIYHPDDGLFARVKAVEVTKAESVDVLERKVNDLQHWQTTEQKTTDRDSIMVEEHKKIVANHDDQLRDLSKFRSNSIAVAKWVLVTLAGGGLTMIGKVVYDILIKHLQYV